MTRKESGCVADLATKQSPLAGLDLPAGSAVSVAELPFLGKLILRGDVGAFRDAVRGVVGVNLPDPLRFAVSESCSVLWQGPDSWLLTGDMDKIRETEAALRTSLAGVHAAVTDVSSGTTVVRLAGPAARDVLYKGCALDLDPPAFTTGACVPNRIAAFAVTLVQIDDTPTYDLYVARSLARTFVEWLIDACGEFVAG
jgi:sarcosine oxidase subunit gamma